MKLNVLIIIILALCPAVAAMAEDATTEKKAEFRKAISERNRQMGKLVELDRKAAELVKSGKDATKVNAEQIATQDKLDTAQLKVETMAARYGFEVPAAPEEKDFRQLADQEQNFGRDAFERGRQRTLDEVKRQTLEFLKSIDYSVMLSKTEVK
jgi:hypothetical protein